MYNNKKTFKYAIFQYTKIVMNLFQVYIEDVEKDAKALKASKQAQTKKCLERIQIVQKDLQESVSEVIAQYISKQ